MRFLKLLSAILVAILLISSSLYLLRHKLLARMGEGLVYEDRLEKCDAAISLAGGFPDRTIEAADIFTGGYVSKIIVINEIEGAGFLQAKKRNLSALSENDQVDRLLDSMRVPKGSVIRLPKSTDRTIEEATEVKMLLKDHPEIKCLVLVTSKFHSLRAKKIFARTLKDEGIKIIARYPSFDDYDPQNWWKKPRDLRNTLNEYAKLLTMAVY